MKKKVFIIILFIFIILGSVITIYINTYYHADKEVNNYLKTNDIVKVEKIKEGYFFDGPGTTNALIFYPGAKVEYTAYAPLMYKLASNGIDTYIIKMTFNIAFFSQNKASDIIKKYNYENWYMSGHSLGGVVISNYVVSKPNNIKGLILLASYPTKEIPNGIKVLSIYGSNDKVLNIKKYNSSIKYLPSDYSSLIIEGGNHANFGNYGNQKHDGNSTISREEQQDITVNKIIEFIK